MTFSFYKNQELMLQIVVKDKLNNTTSYKLDEKKFQSSKNYNLNTLHKQALNKLKASSWYFGYFLTQVHLGLNATKPVFGVSDKARLKPVFSDTYTMTS